MNRQDFINFLNNPELLNENSMEQVNMLVKEFPYCQTAQLLYLKNLHKTNSIHYYSQLKITAAYTSDRKALYHLINDIFESKKNDNGTQNPVNIVENIEENIKEDLTQQQNDENKNSEIKIEIENNTEQFNIIEEKKSEIEILTNISEINDKNEQLEEIVEKKKFKNDNNDFPIINKTEPLKEQQKLSFIEWLKFVDQNKITPIEYKKNKTSDKESKIDLINKFIKEQPNLSQAQPKTEFFSPINVAKHSVIDNEDFVTETLAKIYIKQGNFQKAIKIYEKLSTTYPEKNIYFAEQIKKINEINK
jgi:hypothetical protein